MRSPADLASAVNSLAPMMPESANSVNMAACRSASMVMPYARSISRALPKYCRAKLVLPTLMKMRESSSSRVGTKCGAEFVSEVMSSSKRSLMRRGLCSALRFAHSRCLTRLRACWALSGSVMIGQAGKPTALVMVRPTIWSSPRLRPTDASASSSALSSSVGTSRMMVVPSWLVNSVAWSSELRVVGVSGVARGVMFMGFLWAGYWLSSVLMVRPA